ncbi:MAG: ammonium transporter, partial [Chloroflexi bacterium]|nr:ammonium transporter [Chloroflexota bacterium]
FFLLNGIAPGDIQDGLGIPVYLFAAYQLMFAIITPALITGAFANRMTFKAYFIFLIFWQLLVYYPFVHMVWGGGWMAEFGVLDFAGGIVVHAIAGMAALATVFFLGARRVSEPAPHNVPFVALGTALLWFGWFGFNAGSTLSGNDLTIATIAVTTNISAAAGVVGAMTISYVLFKRFDVTMAINGAIAGLVAITAGTANVSPGMAMIIGLIGGILVVFSVLALERIFKIDDPVGVISAHGVVGAWGTLAVGLFASAQYGGVDGLFFGGGIGQLWVQAVGVLAAFAWTFPVAFIAFKVIDKVIGMRASDEEQLRGLDLTEHGAEGYPEFTGGLSGLPGDVPLVSPAD